MYFINIYKTNLRELCEKEENEDNDEKSCCSVCVLPSLRDLVVWYSVGTGGFLQ